MTGVFTAVRRHPPLYRYPLWRESDLTCVQDTRINPLAASRVAACRGLALLPRQPKRRVSMRSFYKLVSQLLIVCMIWTPFTLQASMIGTDQVATSAQDQSNRDKVINFVQRGDVAKHMEML